MAQNDNTEHADPSHSHFCATLNAVPRGLWGSNSPAALAMAAAAGQAPYSAGPVYAQVVPP